MTLASRPRTADTVPESSPPARSTSPRPLASAPGPAPGSGVLAGQPAHHLAAPPVGALGASGGAVLAHARGGHQVERPGAEPVRGAGQRPDRADLHGVAGEVGLE